MVVDAPDGNGGDAWQFLASTGPYRLLRPKVVRARAKTAASWGWDGGAFQGYGPCGPVIIDEWEVRDSVNVCEVGTDAGMGGVPTGWVFRNGDAWGVPAVVPLTHERACVGFTLPGEYRVPDREQPLPRLGLVGLQPGRRWHLRRADVVATSSAATRSGSSPTRRRRATSASEPASTWARTRSTRTGSTSIQFARRAGWPGCRARHLPRRGSRPSSS